MSKISFPKEGLGQLTNDEIANCRDYISQAASECNFDIPSGFDHKNYLWSLRSNFGKYNLELINIRQEISTIDHSYENISSRAAARIRTYEKPPRIETRNRMIV